MSGRVGGVAEHPTRSFSGSFSSKSISRLRGNYKSVKDDGTMSKSD